MLVLYFYKNFAYKPKKKKTKYISISVPYLFNVPFTLPNNNSLTEEETFKRKASKIRFSIGLVYYNIYIHICSIIHLSFFVLCTPYSILQFQTYRRKPRKYVFFVISFARITNSLQRASQFSSSAMSSNSSLYVSFLALPDLTPKP